MAQIADILIKKADGTTDITYSAICPSSGDGVPAVWRSETVGSAMAHRPEIRLAAKDGQNGAKRVFRATYVYPQIATNTTTGVTSVVDRVMASFDLTFPKGMAQVDVNEAVTQFCNLVASGQFKNALKSGYSNT
ncbi:coat protein [ssRNA phage SRR6960799_21]|uniref:Coat protein n=1 Tax=ssRNA phage SRR6960799_21 TaxID=2786578 RepID=A0A8S5L030_9VIRU|nr:coat protein [ssRNA phage SRR6960799_21]DAD50685.1 TPA_asm: coat protein [ssRNA phage SRR6960799_21]